MRSWFVQFLCLRTLTGLHTFIMKSQELEQLWCVPFMCRMYVSLNLCERIFNMLYNSCDFVARHTGLPSQMTNYHQSFHSNLSLLHPIVTGHHTYQQLLKGLCWRRTTKWYMHVLLYLTTWYGRKVVSGSFLASVQISITT